LRPHRLTAPVVRHVCALAAALALALALALLPAALAGAMPYDNERPPAPAARHVATTPTIVKETIVHPATHVPATVLVLAGAGVIVAMLGAAYLGARMTHQPRH